MYRREHANLWKTRSNIEAHLLPSEILLQEGLGEVAKEEDLCGACLGRGFVDVIVHVHCRRQVMKSRLG